MLTQSIKVRMIILSLLSDIQEETSTGYVNQVYSIEDRLNYVKHLLLKFHHTEMNPFMEWEMFASQYDIHPKSIKPKEEPVLDKNVLK